MLVTVEWLPLSCGEAKISDKVLQRRAVMISFVYRIDQSGIQLQRTSDMFLQSQKHNKQGRVFRFKSENEMQYAII